MSRTELSIILDIVLLGCVLLLYVFGPRFPRFWALVTVNFGARNKDRGKQEIDPADVNDARADAHTKAMVVLVLGFVAVLLIWLVAF